VSKKIYIFLIVVAIFLVILLVVKKTKILAKNKPYDQAEKSGYKYFLLSEFDSKATFPSDNGKEVYTKNGVSYLKNSGKDNMKASNLQMLDVARNGVENTWNTTNPLDRITFVISSGYRTPIHNQNEGSTSDNHPEGWAEDISTKGFSLAKKKVMLRELYKAGFRRFGIAKNFIHVDNNPTKQTISVWNYGNEDAESLGTYDINDIKLLA